MKNPIHTLGLIVLGLVLATLPGCENKEREITFTSEITEEEQRELDAREAGFSESVSAARAAREAAQEEADENQAAPARSNRHVVLALPEARSEIHANLHDALEQRFAEEPGISYEMLDAASDPNTQLAQLHGLAANPPDVLLVTAVAANEIGLPIETLMESGTRVIAVEHELADCAPNVTLHLDYKAIGKVVGAFTIRSLQRKQEEQEQPSLTGRVVVIRGDETGETCRLIQGGFIEALQEHPGVVLVHDAPGFWDLQETAARFAEAARLQEEFDVVFAHSDRMALAAHAASREFEMQHRLLFIGIGGAPGPDGGLAAVTNGVLGATVRISNFTDEAIAVVTEMLQNPGAYTNPTKRGLSWSLYAGDEPQRDGAAAP